MEASTSSHGVIPEDKLKPWTVFRNVGADGEEILKAAKLIHVHDKEGFVVTTTDETYHFIHKGLDDAKITRIPELCNVLVKEFIIGSVNLAITEDGLLYSWCSEFRPADVPFDRRAEHLGRIANCREDKYTPRQVPSYLTRGKIRQVALPGMGMGNVVALTEGGDVYQWGTFGEITIWAPMFVDKEEWDCGDLVSVGCNFGANYALSERGEVFRWGFGADDGHKLSTRGIPVKKIATTQNTICALTFDGKVHSWRAPAVGGNLTWSTKPVVVDFYVQDIRTCWMEDVCVVDFKSNYLACYLDKQPTREVPYFLVRIEECFARICQKSYGTIIMERSQEDKKPSLGDDLWSSKDTMDATFSLQGKIISAHKLILTCRSEYFAKMFSGEWSETKGSVIEIKDTKYDIFEALLFHIYHDKVTFSEKEYENICGLMKLADCYCEVKIRRECEGILMRNIGAENAFFLLQHAVSANALNLEEKVTKFILENRLVNTISLGGASDLVALLGREAFDKFAMAALRR
ncbi:RCC1 and BTB domain-containing protein 1 [Folsomia candida]|uniref:RCC1 and BTB domain-containing protein 1 n=1 Tax=Folsomia candida TaxID=158441 RepID=A0A226EDF3_FOLCA|nr:RCC1 and BTB domain-containing protein 1 [Folsomia candida]OXA54821.1 RCC1 and BTB domain-containing protein 1 [Folsomia candida]